MRDEERRSIMKTRATILSLASLFVALLLALVITAPTWALAPIFNNQTLTIAENSFAGSSPSPSKPNAFDPENEPLTWDILPEGDGLTNAFAVNASTGIITVSDPSQLDFETKQKFTLKMRVTDTDNPAPVESTTATVTINLIDQPDVPPVMGDQEFDITENSAAGATVGTLAYSDPDTDDSHTFTITSGPAPFVIDGIGKITVAAGAQLNFETTAQYNLTVEVEDEGGNTDAANVTIDVTDVNENPTIAPQTFTIPEDAANGATVGTVIAADPEDGTLTFSIDAGTPFAINANTGVLTVADKSKLDFETKPQIKFKAKAQDNGAPPKSGEGEITVNVTAVNDPPQANPGIADVVVNEGAPPKAIDLRAAFADDEDPDTALDFLVQSNSNPGLVATSINDANGTLTLTFTGAGIANITVRAFDTDGAWVDDTFKVDINDAPTAPATQNVTVNEDAENSIIDLYDVFDDAEDADAALVYAFVSTNNPGLFTTPSPNITGGHFLTLDYAADANGKADVVVKATDTGGLFAQTTFKVTVNEANDAPTTSGIQNVNVDEDAEDRVVNLGAAFADKEDADGELNYEVQANSNPGLFDAVTVNDSAATLTLNFKANTSGAANLTVRATDSGNLFVETSFTVTVGGVNDAPTLGNIEKSIQEDQTLEFTTADFTAKFTDTDGDPLVSVRIDSLPADGNLKLDGADVAQGQVIPAAQLNNLDFVPASNWDQGSTSFNWNATDGTSYAAAPAKVTITVQAQNDPPTVSDFELIGPEGVNINFTQQDFINNFADVDGGELEMVRIISLPANGVLRRGNVTVGINEQIAASDLGQLRFVPADNWSGTTSFKWNGSDGTTYALNPATVTLVVTPENDAPYLDLNGGGEGTGFSTTFVAGGPPVVIVGSGLDIDDIDSETMTSATATILNRPNGAKEVLSANTAGTNIQYSFSAANGVLLLNGEDTIANYEKVLRTVKYHIDPEVTNPATATRTVSFKVYDDGELGSNNAESKVNVINPRIEVSVTDELQTVHKGGTAVFKIEVSNTGDVDLTNIRVRSANVPDCNKDIALLEAGKTAQIITCHVANVTTRIDNTVVVTATHAPTNTTVTDDDLARVRVVGDIAVNIAPDQTLVRGQNATFTVIVANPSEVKLTNVQVKAFIDYNVLTQVATPSEAVPAPACNSPANFGDLNGGQEKQYTCTISSVTASFNIEARASATIEGLEETTDFDIAKVDVLDTTLEVFADPFEVLAGQPTTVEFNLTLTNVSNLPVTLKSLQSATHGNLLSANNGVISKNSCQSINLSIAAGEVRTCSYEVTLILQPPAFTNVVTSVVESGGRQLTITDEALVSVADFSPLEVALTADPSSVVAPGGEVNLSVLVTNNTSSELTLDRLNDSIEGNVSRKGTCNLPAVLAANGSYSCIYPTTIKNKVAGAVVRYTVTAIADAEQEQDSVDIAVTAGPQVQLMLPAVAQNAVAGEPNNGICSAMALLTNQNYYFLPDDANDWYRFELEQPGRVTVKLGNFMADGQILVYASNNCVSPGGHVGHNGNLEPVKQIDLGVRPAGTYFVWVVAAANFSATAPYSLRIEVSTP
jgi:uncharacterized repeat protein (TIGR01451 family)